MRKLIFASARLGLVSTTLLAGVSSARADARDDEIKRLREQLELFDQKLRVLERKQEIRDEESAAAAKTAPRITANDKGFTIASPDAANSVRLRGLVQADARLYLDDGSITTNDSLVLRRARLILEGQFAKLFQFQLVPEFGGSAVSILDANANLVISRSFQLRAGKFKSPVGLEQLQSDSWAFFTERAFPSQLVANRDIGVQAWGDFADGTISYAADVFNGVGDGGSTTNSDFDDDKEIAGRVFFSPFKNVGGSPFQNLGFGVAASVGSEEGAGGLSGGYRTDGQQTFFRYRSTTIADGEVWRVSPQAYWYRGPLGLLGEYVQSTTNARVGTTGAKGELKNKAWQLAASFVLTGEDASYNGVVPATNFDPSAGTWGAWEAVARFSSLDVDDAAFPLFADPAASATGATAFGVGVNWYLSKSVRASADYFQTRFTKAAGAPATAGNAVIRQDEKAFITRLQLAF